MKILFDKVIGVKNRFFKKLNDLVMIKVCIYIIIELNIYYTGVYVEDYV